MYAPESRVSTISNALDAAQWFRATEQLKNVRTSAGVLEVWFHGLITRKQAEDLLENKPVGSFLMRVSQTRFGYSLSFKGKARCYHVAVEQRGSLYIVIGDNRASFRSLRDLIIFYKRHPVVEEGYVLTDAVGQEDDTCDYTDLISDVSDITLTPTMEAERPPSVQVTVEVLRGSAPARPAPTFTSTPTHTVATPTRPTSPPTRTTSPPLPTRLTSQNTTPAPVLTKPAAKDTRPVQAVSRPAPAVHKSPVLNNNNDESRISRHVEESVRRKADKQDIVAWFRKTQMSPLMKKQGGFYPWFYGIVSRSKAELMLKDKPAGCFFVRVCDDQCMLCLSMKGGRGKVKHFDIACLPNKKYQVIGELKDFRSINNLISYYKMYPISAFGDKLHEVGCREGHVIDYTDLLQGDEIGRS